MDESTATKDIHEVHTHTELGFVSTYIFSTDHKMIGIQYGITSLLFLAFGFSLMLIMRWQLGNPGQPVPFIGGLLGQLNAPGGIVLPGSAKEKPNQGEVIAVGEGKLLDNGELRAVGVKAGDQVIFGQYSGNSVKVDGEELIILNESDIFGVVEG